MPSPFAAGFCHEKTKHFIVHNIMAVNSIFFDATNKQLCLINSCCYNLTNRLRLSGLESRPKTSVGNMNYHYSCRLLHLLHGSCINYRPLKELCGQVHMRSRSHFINHSNLGYFPCLLVFS